MTMPNNGLDKLTEECGELLQIIGKLSAYTKLQKTRDERHPDGTMLLDRLQEEMADVLAAINFVVKKLKIEPAIIIHPRSIYKVDLYKSWDNE